jgi:hypothetical protein
MIRFQILFYYPLNVSIGQFVKLLFFLSAFLIDIICSKEKHSHSCLHFPPNSFYKHQLTFYSMAQKRLKAKKTIIYSLDNMVYH